MEQWRGGAGIAEAQEAPRARQAQTVEMAVLGVGVVVSGGRLGERTEARGREAPQPAREFAFGQRLLHEQRLANARRQEIVERRLIGERCGAVALVPATRGLADL